MIRRLPVRPDSRITASRISLNLRQVICLPLMAGTVASGVHSLKSALQQRLEGK